MGKKCPFAIALFLLLALPLIAQDGSKDAILTTDHDLRGTFTLTGEANNVPQVCVFCHIPHGLQDGTNPVTTLLWNHRLSANASYTMYSSASLKASETQLKNTDTTQLKGEAFYSLACLSCHDGSTAVNAVYRIPDGVDSTGNYIGGAGQTINDLDPTGMHTIGASGDLSQTHPINFVYDSALANVDKGIWDVGAGGAVRVLGGSLIKAVRYPDTVFTDGSGALRQPLLFNDTVQCASCHNPHNNSYGPYLRVPIKDSELCFKCHSTSSTYSP